MRNFNAQALSVPGSVRRDDGCDEASVIFGTGRSTAIGNLIDHLEHMNQVATEIRDICGMNADRILGPQPESEAEDGKQQPRPGGMFAEVQMRVETLERTMSQVLDRVQRFNDL